MPFNLLERDGDERGGGKVERGWGESELVGGSVQESHGEVQEAWQGRSNVR